MDQLADRVEPRRSRGAARWALAAAAAGALAGCSDGGKVPEFLLDGSPAPSAPQSVVESTERVVMTRARVVRADLADRLVAACARRMPGLGTATILVERVGVSGASITFRSRAAPHVRGCDRSGVPSESGSPWCGVSIGKLGSGGVTDPRLGILCRDRAGGNVAFAWVNPSARARWLGVEQEGYVELYRVAGGLPVRVSSRAGVKLESSSATFRIVEFAADGARIRERELVARVAG